MFVCEEWSGMGESNPPSLGWRPKAVPKLQMPQMVPSRRIERRSTVLQTAAMTTLARWAKLVAAERIALSISGYEPD